MLFTVLWVLSLFQVILCAEDRTSYTNGTLDWVCHSGHWRTCGVGTEFSGVAGVLQKFLHLCGFQKCSA